MAPKRQTKKSTLSSGSKKDYGSSAETLRQHVVKNPGLYETYLQAHGEEIARAFASGPPSASRGVLTRERLRNKNPTGPVVFNLENDPQPLTDLEEENKRIFGAIINAVRQTPMGQTEEYAELDSTMLEVRHWALIIDNTAPAPMFSHQSFEHISTHDEELGPRTDQRRVCVGLYEGHDFFEGTSPRQCAELLDAFYEQVAFFTGEDCCIHNAWIHTSTSMFQVAARLAAASLKGEAARFDMAVHFRNRKLITTAEERELWPTGLDHAKVDAEEARQRAELDQRRQTERKQREVINLDFPDNQNNASNARVQRHEQEEQVHRQAQNSHEDMEVDERAPHQEIPTQSPIWTRDQVEAQIRQEFEERQTELELRLQELEEVNARLRSEQHTSFAPIDHDQEEPNPFLELSMNPGGTNLLVTREPLPTFNEFEPGKHSNRLLCKFVSNAIRNGQPLEIERWPLQLRNKITGAYNVYLWIAQADSNSTVLTTLPAKWEQLTPEELQEWLFSLLDDEDASENSDNPYKRFAQELGEGIVIKWDYKGNPYHNPFHIRCQSILGAWNRIKPKFPNGTNLEERERFTSKLFLRNLRHSGCGSKFTGQMKTSISILMPNPTMLEETVRVIQQYVIQMMRQIANLECYYDKGPTKSSSSHGSSSGSKSSSSTSSSSSKKRKESFTESSWDSKRNWDSASASKKNKTKGSSKAKAKVVNTARQCKGCGWMLASGATMCNRTARGCLDDPRRNQTDLPWHLSPVGKAWMAHGYTRGFPKPLTVTLENAAAKRAEHLGKSMLCIAQICESLAINTEMLTFNALISSQRPCKRSKRNSGQPSRPLPVGGKLLLDTGAIGCCVVSKTFASKLDNANCITQSRKVKHSLVTALNDKTLTNKEITFDISILREHSTTAEPVTMSITAIVAKINIDLVLDKATIKANNLAYHFASHFATGPLLDHIQQLSNESLDEESTPSKRIFVAHKEIKPQWVDKFKQCASTQHSRFLKGRPLLQTRTAMLYSSWLFSTEESSDESDNSDDETVNTVKELNGSMSELQLSGSTVFINTITGTNFSKKPAFEREGSMAEIPDNKLESIPAELLSDVRDEAEYLSVQISGTPLSQQRIRSLIRNNKDVFRATVQAQAANFTPFELHVDEAAWFSKKNQTPARPMSVEKQTAMREMMKILQEHDIIEPSVDGHYSHAFLVPKPNGKWRLVLDFKNLNAATTNQYQWPLPDIQNMLQRVGQAKPQFFAVFDLTSGYYQAPIAKESRKFTAFMAFHGIYRWKRLPMGLTGAGSYFQHSLVTQCLKELMHNGVELYLDDCMVHADSIELFIERLEEVFRRFKGAGITLNPAKCKIGLQQVEYVGHTIDKDGLHFTRSKLDSVVHFPRPMVKKHVKSFVGLANYFRDHIRSHSDLERPLLDLVPNYERKHANQPVDWTEAAEKAFDELKVAIDQCPKLWFLDTHSPIFLQTDASDYGIGAYLYQVVSPVEGGPDREHPVGFISKSIAKGHSNWDTPMKEGYAIFYALKKWEYLLRDRAFTVLTDHKNLTLLKSTNYLANKMVQRWFMVFQEFDIIEWGYRPGENNEIPDTLSRLCSKEVEETPAVHYYQITGKQVDPEMWDIIARYHNSMERGHGGIQRTLALLEANDHDWPGMYTDVRRFIQSCPCCQKMSQIRKVVHAYPFTTSAYGLWNTISIDFIERLTEDEYGFSNVIVIVDNFSRFTDLIPTKAINAEVAADSILSFCGKYQTPLNICTDSGSAFTSDMVNATIERLGSHHNLTIAYSKEQNAIVERQNKEVLRHLRNIIFEKRVMNKWSKYLPIVQRIINSSVNSSTGLAPAEIVFPNSMQLDRELLIETHPVYTSSYVRELQQAQAAIIEACERSLRSKDELHMQLYPPDRTVFENGSYVLVEHRHNALRRGPKSKLLPFLKGPLRVRGHDDQGNYALQDLVTQRIHNYHVSKLRHFQFDPATMDPVNIAVTDMPDEFVVQECLAMQGRPTGPKAQLSFKIRWAGYGPEDDTWEPWSYVRDNDAVLTYLSHHPNPKVRRLVPANFIPPDQRMAEEDDNQENVD